MIIPLQDYYRDPFSMIVRKDAVCGSVINVDSYSCKRKRPLLVIVGMGLYAPYVGVFIIIGLFCMIAIYVMRPSLEVSK